MAVKEEGGLRWCFSSCHLQDSCQGCSFLAGGGWERAWHLTKGNAKNKTTIMGEVLIQKGAKRGVGS